MTRKLDRLNASNSTGIAFQRLWQRNCETAEANFADQQSQLDTIDAMLDPNTLTPVEKPVWMVLESYLTGEQSSLDAQATAYGITTEKTAYDNAITALTGYLATLTTPVAWNDTSGNTAIVGTTFRGDFTTVLTAKQALLDKMHGSAKTLANNAQTTANTGVANAATAQGTANTAVSNAATAQSTANTVKRDDAISSSATSPGSILTATDAGSNCTITIATHSREYGDINPTSVTGATITGLVYSTEYFIYYDQTSRAGGTVTYHATTNAKTALPSSAAGRHFCGSVTTPVAGGGATSGGVDPPAGGGGVGQAQIP